MHPENKNRQAAGALMKVNHGFAGGAHDRQRWGFSLSSGLRGPRMVSFEKSGSYCHKTDNSKASHKTGN